MSSNWQEKFKNFETAISWEKYKNSRQKLNEYRLIKIDFKLYLEVKALNSNLTFLANINNFNLIQNYTWYSWKCRNTYYISTCIKKKLKLFHRMIHPEWKITDHINRNGLDNRDCNLRETTPKENALNRKLFKNNSSGYNGIYYCKKREGWEFQYKENNKRKTKWFLINKKRTNEQAKQLAIEFKLAHDKKTGNLNGYIIQ